MSSATSGTTNGLALGDNRFTLRYPLQATGPTPVTLHRSGIPDLATNIVWRELDLGDYVHAETMSIRLGDSLLLTAGVGQTGTLQIAIMDGSNQVFRTYEGVAGQKIPALFDQAGVFTVTAMLNGATLGSMVVNVAYVNFDGPIACGVGFKREKGVEVYGPLDQIFFTSKYTNLEVSVKAQTAYGVRLYLKPTSRTLPVVVQARLGGTNGPVLAEQKIDAFDLDYSPVTHIVVNAAIGIASTHMTMKPWIPNIDVNCEMYAHFSTFADGSTAYKLNTSDFGGKNVNGDPAVELVVDAQTGETQAVLRVDFGMPPDEPSYCFQATFDQHSKYGTVVLRANCNGTGDLWKMWEAYWGEDEIGPKTVTVSCWLGHIPAKSHFVVSLEPDLSAFGLVDCEPPLAGVIPIPQTVTVDKTAMKTAGIYNLKIEDTSFPVMYVIRVDVDEIHFNHDTSAMTTDGVTMKEDKDNDIEAPEWKLSTSKNEPGCYIKSTTGKVKVKLSIEPDTITSAKIRAMSAGGDLPNLNDKTVSFTGGTSALEEFTMSSALPGAVDKIEDSWVWKVSDVDGSGSAECDAGESGEHKVFVVLGTPKSPMQKPWEGVLDIVCSDSWAGGENDFDPATSAIVEEFYDVTKYDENVIRYTTFTGTWPLPSHVSQKFSLTTFLAEQFDTSKPFYCADYANAVIILGNALGCDLHWRYKQCDNGGGEAEFKSRYLKSAGVSTSGPTSGWFVDHFPYHQFVEAGTKVWDASSHVDGDADASTRPCTEQSVLGVGMTTYHDKFVEPSFAADWEDPTFGTTGVPSVE